MGKLRPQPKKKLKKFSTLERELDRVFSIFIRTRDSKDGFVKCCTCPNVIPIEEAHCCHFVPRAKRSTRWDVINCYGGCPRCNVYDQMHPYKLGKHIDNLHGAGTAEGLMIKGNQIAKFSRDELMEMIEKYK